jgi:hypothetical protein
MGTPAWHKLRSARTIRFGEARRDDGRRQLLSRAARLAEAEAERGFNVHVASLCFGLCAHVASSASNPSDVFGRQNFRAGIVFVAGIQLSAGGHESLFLGTVRSDFRRITLAIGNRFQYGLQRQAKIGCNLLWGQGLFGIDMGRMDELGSNASSLDKKLPVG